MSTNNKNEIIKLLKNLELSKFLDCPGICIDDENANIAISSLYMLLKRRDYPIHFDKNSNGCFVPDIVMYLSPPLYDERILLDTFEKIKIYENSMKQRIIGVEHFKIGNFSFIKRNGKVMNKLSEYEAKLNGLDIGIEESINDLQNFQVEGRVEILKAFEIVYQKHYSKLEDYQKKIQEDNLLGHVTDLNGNKINIPTWFLIECDDCIYFDKNGREVPIFLTPQGRKIIIKTGIPDGIIYFGRTGVFAFSKEYIKGININGRITFAYPQKEQYVRFRNNEWGKTLGSYIKII